MGRWILIAALLGLLAGALFGAYQGWTAHSGDVEVPPWAYAMLGVGIFLRYLSGAALWHFSSTAVARVSTTPRRPNQSSRASQRPGRVGVAR